MCKYKVVMNNRESIKLSIISLKNCGSKRINDMLNVKCQAGHLLMLIKPQEKSLQISFTHITYSSVSHLTALVHAG